MSKFTDYIGAKESVDPDKVAGMKAWRQQRDAKPEINYQAYAAALDDLFYKAYRAVKTLEEGKQPTISSENLREFYQSVKTRFNVS